MGYSVQLDVSMKERNVERYAEGCKYFLVWMMGESTHGCICRDSVLAR